MACKNDKWVMFRNYMHNELGITKEDIAEWIQDAIRDEVKNVVSNAYGRLQSRRDLIRSRQASGNAFRSGIPCSEKDRNRSRRNTVTVPWIRYNERKGWKTIQNS